MAVERKAPQVHYKATIKVPPHLAEELDRQVDVIVVAANKAQALNIVTAEFITLERATPGDLISAGHSEWPVIHGKEGE